MNTIDWKERLGFVLLVLSYPIVIMAHRRFGAFYARSFERRPWLTLAIANGTLGALADTLAQTLEKYNGKQAKATIPTSKDEITQKIQQGNRNEWDLARTSRFFAFGVGMAPLLAEWNKWIEHRFPLRSSIGAGKVSLAALGKRVAVDQIAL